MARTTSALARSTALALTSAVALIALGAATATAARADQSGDSDSDPPLTSLEARVGYGLAFGGGSGTSSQRPSGVTITALVDHAVVVEPWTSIFGGVVAEGYGRGSAGMVVGARVRPARGRIRIAGGGVALLVPASLYGPLASVGGCLPVESSLHLCVDVEATLFVAGTDLPEERIAGQAQLVLGIAFDAW
jgi:hypothetical protein